MRRSLQNGKRRILTVAVIALFLIIAASFGVTFAILAKNTDVKGQDFTIGSLTIVVKDGAGTTEGQFTYSETTDLSENSKIKMTGSIGLSEKSVTSFLRIKPIIEFSGTSATDEQKQTFINKFLAEIFGSNVEGKNGVFKQGENNAREWFKATTDDGYYYYAGKFSASTKSVLNGTITMPNVDAFQDSTFTVKFTIEAIQASAITDWSEDETTQQKVDKLAGESYKDVWASASGKASSSETEGNE